MSVPLILPKGNDRSWTRSFYRAINKIFRRMWYLQRCDEKLEKAWQDSMVYGVGSFRLDAME